MIANLIDLEQPDRNMEIEIAEDGTVIASSGGRGGFAQFFSLIYMAASTVTSTGAPSAGNGFNVGQKSMLHTDPSTVKSFISKFTTGEYSFSGSQIDGNTNVSFSANTANTSTDSPGTYSANGPFSSIIN